MLKLEQKVQGKAVKCSFDETPAAQSVFFTANHSVSDTDNVKCF